MLFNVPQYIDVEDKVAGPLTVKQLLWMLGMGAVLLVLWNTLDKTTFFIVAIPVGVLFTALAFYRPYNQPLISFIISSISFLFSPKVYIWKRSNEGGFSKRKSDRKPMEVSKKEKKMPKIEDIEMLARVLDSGGRERNEKIMELIKQSQKSKAKN